MLWCQINALLDLEIGVCASVVRYCVLPGEKDGRNCVRLAWIESLSVSGRDRFPSKFATNRRNFAASVPGCWISPSQLA